MNLWVFFIFLVRPLLYYIVHTKAGFISNIKIGKHKLNYDKININLLFTMIIVYFTILKLVVTYFSITNEPIWLYYKEIFQFSWCGKLDTLQRILLGYLYSGVWCILVLLFSFEIVHNKKSNIILQILIFWNDNFKNVKMYFFPLLGHSDLVTLKSL